MHSSFFFPRHDLRTRSELWWSILIHRVCVTRLFRWVSNYNQWITEIQNLGSDSPPRCVSVCMWILSYTTTNLYQTKAAPSLYLWRHYGVYICSYARHCEQGKTLSLPRIHASDRNSDAWKPRCSESFLFQVMLRFLASASILRSNILSCIACLICLCLSVCICLNKKNIMRYI